MGFGRETNGLGDLGVHVSHCRNQLVAHAKGRTELIPLSLVEHIDRARLGPGNLRRLGDDNVEHRLQIEGRVDCLGDLPKRP